MAKGEAPSRKYGLWSKVHLGHDYEERGGSESMVTMRPDRVSLTLN